MGEIQRIKQRKRDYYAISKRLRREVLVIADSLLNNPKYFSVENGINMDVEITKADLKTIVGKNIGDDKFNAIKNALAKDIEGYLRRATYEGWRERDAGKHFESAYFAYFSRRFGVKTYLIMRRMKDSGKFKPYAIVDEPHFNAKRHLLKMGTPP